MTDNPSRRAVDRRRLAFLTSRTAADAGVRRAVVLVPTGATEQHGPHLPLGTDALIAEAIAGEVAAEMDDVLVADPVGYGCSWHHLGFPGTVSLGTAAFIALVFDVCRSLSDSGFVPVLLNGHFGNKAPAQVALTDLAEAGVRAFAFSYFDLIGEDVGDVLPDPSSTAGHACALETSLVMHLWPEAVVQDAIPSGDTPTTWPDPHMFANPGVSVVRPFDEINPSGVIGRPSVASPERGSELFDLAVVRCKEAVAKILEQTRR